MITCRGDVIIYAWPLLDASGEGGVTPDRFSGDTIHAL